MVQQIARTHARVGMAALCGLLVIAFAGAGIVKLIPIEFERASFAHFGYAPWFMCVVGVLEIVGAALLLLPESRCAGALCLGVLMAGAVASHLRAGDGLGMATPALVLFVLLAVVAAASAGAMRALLRNAVVGLLA